MSPTRLGDPRIPYAIRSRATPELTAIGASELTDDRLGYEASEASDETTDAAAASEVIQGVASIFAIWLQMPTRLR